MINHERKITHFMSSFFLIFMLINLKNFKKMILTPLIEYQNLEPMNIAKYFKTTKVAEFLSETIGKGRKNKETA